ncbi:MAG: hypothetical protein ACRD6X_15900 [Pyrinomonadaceae bacterium]
MTQAVEQTDSSPAGVRLSELDQPIWSVISFDRVEGNFLDYAGAVRLQNELEFKGVAGLCIVTDAAAARTNR